MALTFAPAAILLTACMPEPDHTSKSGGADIGAGFVRIPASTFDVGSTPGQPDFGYGVHSVTLTHDYFVGVTEVTQGQFSAVMGYNPSAFTDCDGLGPDDCPVETLNWYQAAAYANATSAAASTT